MERFYRTKMKNSDLNYYRVVYKQTDLYIGSNEPMGELCLEIVTDLRKQLDTYIEQDPVFLSSLYPIDLKPEAPLIAKLMDKASKSAFVGPMAAVAGAFCALLAENLKPFTKDLIIENGGDIFIKSNKERTVSLYAGENKFKDKIHILLSPDDMPLGVCTSSGKFGHSLSFGKADAVCIISKDATLADAVATATANRIQTAKDIPSAIDFASSINNVSGVMAVCDDKIGFWGNIKLI